MDLDVLLQMTPETLALSQHQALKEHTVRVLTETAAAIAAEQYDTVGQRLFFSPAGDGNGVDNYCIDFGWAGAGTDMGKTVDRLIELKALAEKTTKPRKG